MEFYTAGRIICPHEWSAPRAVEAFSLDFCAYSDGMVGIEFTVEPAQLQFVVMDCLRVVTNDLSGITLGTDGHKQVIDVIRRGAILKYVPNLVEQVLGCGPQYEHKLLRISNGHERYDYYGVRLKQTRKGIYKLLIMKL